ncbi:MULTISPECIES: HAD-IA family hydrolase [unclassified Sphingobacterium]|uniref:HAD-IA family hydrolase n=1 Tax=unclassified Sphingobacterium TaxID=2609468 RepID=UPI0025EAD4E4|nr:HAD-IA family hydrolase [Sphingobacterium sp. UBA5670]
MKSYKHILFDLDGTLTDPAEGITKCIAYALESKGIQTSDLNSLKSLIGPPLKDSFMHTFGFEENEAITCVEKYRERFSTVGLYENILFDRVPELLEQLKSRDYHIYLATSKPEIFAKKILSHFAIDQYFDFAGGSALDDSRPTKTSVIQYVMENTNLTDPQNCIMIGDRKHDLIGARETGMDAIGVLYGYGSRTELEQESPAYLLHSVADLIEFFD